MYHADLRIIDRRGDRSPMLVGVDTRPRVLPRVGTTGLLMRRGPVIERLLDPHCREKAAIEGPDRPRRNYSSGMDSSTRLELSSHVIRSVRAADRFT
jgi:hypothetical protein